MRNPKVTQVFQHGQLLSMERPEYREWVLTFLTLQFLEDKRKGDITVHALFPDRDARMKAEIVAKENGILAGLEELSAFCEAEEIGMISETRDGNRVKKGEVVATLSGPIGKLLETERMGLDLLGRMSGIATLTHELSEKVKKNSSVALAATRKTLWGLLDKKAVYLGGGLTHRLGLWQAILVKDNHLIALHNLHGGDAISESIKLSTQHPSSEETRVVEVEVESFEAARSAIQCFQECAVPSAVFGLLLDNFSPSLIDKTVAFLTEQKLRDKILLEASGGINRENLTDYANTQVDLISLGSLTHSAPHLDFSERVMSKKSLKV